MIKRYPLKEISLAANCDPSGRKMENTICQYIVMPALYKIRS